MSDLPGVLAQEAPAEVPESDGYACPNCGDDRPRELRVSCSTCGTRTCVWCSRDFHAIGVHPTGKTLGWKEPTRG